MQTMTTEAISRLRSKLTSWDEFLALESRLISWLSSTEGDVKRVELSTTLSDKRATLEQLEVSSID